MVMDKAVVLLTLEPSAESGVLEQLRALTGVLEAHLLYGPYDAYAKIEAKDSQELQNLVIDQIRNIDGITSTMTCFIAD